MPLTAPGQRQKKDIKVNFVFHLLIKKILTLKSIKTCQELTVPKGILKGPWHEIFDLWFFFSSNISPDPEVENLVSGSFKSFMQ
jgi:hypothetical protein